MTVKYKYKHNVVICRLFMTTVSQVFPSPFLNVLSNYGCLNPASHCLKLKNGILPYAQILPQTP